MPTEISEAFIFEAIRTLLGKGNPSGALHGVKPIDLVVGLIEELGRCDGRYGLITLCVAGGMGVATIIERVRA